MKPNHLFKDPISKNKHSLRYGRLGLQHVNLRGHNLAHNNAQYTSRHNKQFTQPLWAEASPSVPMNATHLSKAHRLGTGSALHLGDFPLWPLWLEVPLWSDIWMNQPLRPQHQQLQRVKAGSRQLPTLLGGPREAWLIGSLFGGGARFVGPK